MSDSIITAATVVTLLIGMGASLWKFWRWKVKGEVDRTLRDEELSQGIHRISQALEDQGKEVEILKGLAHKDDIRHAEMKSAVEALAHSVREADQDLKDILKMFIDRGM